MAVLAAEMNQQIVNAGFAVFWGLIGILLYAMGCLVAIKLWDKATHGIDEIKELKENNTSVAMIFSALILGMAYVLVNIMK
ncbi:MAG: DUF350 domain-containing protein [Candidatus Undinarchaeales archaeon]|jgi:uncharacterized membrane protein YjfL (UPF0719 family)|nr:DUF350 domain-containing protein [Methanopyri archaeon]MDP7080613.1 DUF350 domain-containing protein [Candidatus Undinarchaeales archaeon]MDP7492701.1 DUF350 domain-containing protein [Candidatus Undinarchaeales archaeon]